MLSACGKSNFIDKTLPQARSEISTTKTNQPGGFFWRRPSRPQRIEISSCPRRRYDPTMRSPLQALRPAHCTRSISGTLPSLPRLQTFHSRTRCTRGSFSVILPERRTCRQNSLPMSCILFRSTSRRIVRRCTLRIPGLFRSFPLLSKLLMYPGSL